MRYSEFLIQQTHLVRFCVLMTVPVFALVVAMQHVLQGADVAALQLTFLPESFASVVSQYSPAQLDGIRLHFGFDNLFAVFYGFWLSGIVALRIRRVPALAPFAFLVAWAPLAGLADLIENSCLIPYAADLLSTPPSLIVIMSFAALIKWIILTAILAFLTVSFFPLKKPALS